MNPIISVSSHIPGLICQSVGDVGAGPDKEALCSNPAGCLRSQTRPFWKHVDKEFAHQQCSGMGAADHGPNNWAGIIYTGRDSLKVGVRPSM